MLGEELRAASQRIDRLELENAHLYEQLAKAKSQLSAKERRMAERQKMHELSRYERDAMGNELAKAQARIGRQRKVNREQHRALKEAKELIARLEERLS